MFVIADLQEGRVLGMAQKLPQGVRRAMVRPERRSLNHLGRCPNFARLASYDRVSTRCFDPVKPRFA